MIEKIAGGWIEEVTSSFLLGRKATHTRTGETGIITHVWNVWVDDEYKRGTEPRCCIEMQIGSLICGTVLEAVIIH